MIILLDMQVSTFQGSRHSTVIVAVTGEIDLYSLSGFVFVVAEEMKKNRDAIIVDFSALDYLDSSGVGCIIRLIKDCQNHNTRLLFCGVKGTPLKVLDLSKILALMNLATDRLAAEAMLVLDRFKQVGPR